MTQTTTYKAFLYLCLIFLSNFVLKPVRDQLVVEYLLDDIQWLFSTSFVVTMLFVPAISLLLNKVKLNKLITWFHMLYALLLLVTSQFLAVESAPVTLIILFIIGSNFFNLLFISLFWNLLTDIFQKNQATQSFVFIASGATIGSLLGPVLILFFTNNTSLTEFLWFIGAIHLILPLLLNFSPSITEQEISSLKNTQNSIGHLSGSMVLYATISSFLYVIIAHEIDKFQLTINQVINVFALRDLLINLLTLLIQIAIAKGWVKVRFPYGFMSMPLLTLILFGSAVLFPSIYFLIGFQIIQKSGSRGLIKPSHEIIFSDYYHKYKRGIKNFIDMVLYRVGDMLGAWLFIFVGYIGTPNISIPIVGGLLSICWLFYNYKIGQTKKSFKHVE